MIKQDFVIIFGAPRSGTYLLSTLLQRHFSIAIQVETHLVPIFSKKLWAFGNLKKISNRLRLLDCIYNYVEILIYRGFRLNTPEAQKNFSLLITRPYKHMIADQSTDFKSLIANLFASPIAQNLMAKSAKEVTMREMMVEGVLAIQSGVNPRIVEDKLLSYLSPVERKEYLVDNTYLFDTSEYDNGVNGIGTFEHDFVLYNIPKSR